MTLKLKVKVVVLSFAVVLALLTSVFAASVPESLVNELAQSTEDKFQISYHSKTGKARFLRTEPGKTFGRQNTVSLDASPEAEARGFLSKYGPLFGIEDQSKELTLKRKKTVDRGRSFTRFQQVYNNVPVFGGELIIQTDSSRNVLSVNGKTSPNLPVNTTPSIDADAAQEKALALVTEAYNIDASKLTVTVPELWIYNPILLGHDFNISSLVWRIEVQATDLSPINELVLVDAHRGLIALHFNQVEYAKHRRIYDNNNVYPLPLQNGLPARSEGQGPVAEQQVNKAYDNIGYTYDFFLNYHGRDSIDNAGMQLVGTVRVCDDTNCPPELYHNAYWNGSQMVFSDGFASALDVVGHELTHGVTQHEAGLLYYMQSGAINESLSDVWGEFIQQTYGTPTQKWLIGEDLPTGSIRSMSNPPAFNQPDKMTSSMYLCRSDSNDSYNDNGGVHTNSGVNNKAAYLLGVDGSSFFNGTTVTGLGIIKTAKIYYEALTNLLTSASDYADLYDLLQLACDDLIGTSGITVSDCQQVKNAVDAVEMNLQPINCPDPCPYGSTPVDVFSDNFENGLGNWSHGSVVGADAWSLPTGHATSGSYSLWANDFNFQSLSYVMQNTAVLLPPASYLHFRHTYEFEPGNYDGGVILYTTDLGATWHDAGPLFINNGYSGVISTSLFGANNPLAGNPAFVGTSNGYISSRLNLSSLAGYNFGFAFEIGTDYSTGAMGWFIDDVRVYTCAVPPTVTTTAATNVGQNSATLNGTITNDGGSSVDERRFSWGLTSTCSDGWVTDNPASPNYGNIIRSGNAFSYNLQVLQPNTTYYFQPWAHNTAGWGKGAPVPFTTQAATDTTPPSASTGLGATPSGWTNVNLFSIDWTNPSDPSGIAGAYYKMGSAPASNTDGTYTTSRPFSIAATAQGGQTIYVWLKDGAGNTSYLNRSSTTLYYDGTSPSDGSLNATAGNAQVALSWSGFSDSGGSALKSYFVVRSTGSYPNNQCTSGAQVYLGTATLITDSVGLTNGTTYYYRVCAYDNAGNVSTGAIASATPQAPASFNYSLSPSGSITVTQGSSSSNTITATLTSGTTQSISFSASGLPSGAIAAFSPGSCSPTYSSTLTISTNVSTPIGTFPITVTGQPLNNSTSFNLIVNPVSCTPSSLLVAINNPSSGFAVTQGNATPVNATVTDNCGTNITSAAVSASFSNGDASSTLNDNSNGNYSNTWTPNNTGSCTITVTALKTGLTGNNSVVSGTVQPTQPGQQYVFVTKWGSQGSGEGQFSGIEGIAVDSTGNLYVVDHGNNRIQKFDSNGIFIRAWGSYGTGNGQFTYPYGIAVDSSNNVYVADSGNSRIQKFTADGTYVAQWGSFGSDNGQFNNPMGIAIDTTGNIIYVLDSGNNRVQRFKSDGTYQLQWGSYGSGNGQFNSAQSIATDIFTDVYVADSGNRRIQKFNMLGNFITKWGSEGSGDGQFLSILGIATDASTNVYATDGGSLSNRRIQKFSAGGAFLTKWGSSGTGDGQFGNLSGVAVDSSGNVYVADASNFRIQKFALAPSDPTPPTAGVVTPSPQYGNFIGSPFSLSTTFIDNESSVTSCEYTIDGSNWLTATLSGTSPTWTCTKTGITGTNGQVLTLNMRATSSGGTGTATAITRTVDSSAPTTTDNQISSNWQGTEKTITLNAGDVAGSGVTASSGIYGCSGTGCAPSVIGGNSMTTNCGANNECAFDVRYYSVDNIGNTEATKTSAYQARVDRKAPVSGSTFNANSGDAQCSLSWDVASDSGSGLHSTQAYEVRYQAGSDPGSCTGGSQAYVGTLLSFPHTGLSNGTTYYYRLCYKDNVGNQSQFTSNPTTCTPQATLDTTPPDTSITGGPSGTITANSTTFTFTGTDNITSTANLVYATYLQGYDSGWSSFSASTSKSYSNLPNASYTFQVKAKDQAGNEDSTPDTRSFTVNYTRPPSTNISVTSPNGGETWVAGTTQTIRWTYAGNPGTYVKIELYKGGVYKRGVYKSTISSMTLKGTNGVGSKTWTIPATQAPGNDYKIKITSTSNSAYTDTSDNNFSIVPTYSISGKVTKSGSATGISGVTITLTGAASKTATTDSYGNYKFAGLINGGYTIAPSKSGYNFSPTNIPVTVSGANVTGQNFTGTVIPTYSISGKVKTSTGTGVSGVTVALSGTASKTTITDYYGNYRFTGLPNGQYRLMPRKTGYSFTPPYIDVTLSGANVTGQDFTRN